ncbi:MAG: NAD(P)/FAD-dependent oxidoreductase [Bdellovibrionota bacterium]
MPKHVAVIGAGPAGLATAKSLQEHDIKATILERGNQLGGLWVPNRSPMWDTMRTNISRYTCSFSDLQHTADTSLFPLVAEMNRYLNAYAKEFSLPEHINLRSNVKGIRPKNGGWSVSTEENGRPVADQHFDGIAISSGFFSKGVIPQIKGRDNFKGIILHSQDYLSAHEFTGLHVVVVGNGLSGVEIASDICTQAASVTHLTKRPSWILPRMLPDPNSTQDIPLDLLFYRRGPLAINLQRTQSEINRWKK